MNPQNAQESIAALTIAFVPVVVLLVALVRLEGHRLISLTRIATFVLLGYALSLLWHFTAGDHDGSLARVAGFEALKAALVATAIFTFRVGFAIDAAIVGLAVGMGTVLGSVTHDVAVNAIPRGWAHVSITVLAQATSTAVFAVLVKTFFDRRQSILGLVAGFAGALLVRQSTTWLPDGMAGVIVAAVALCALLALVLWSSERSLRSWLGRRFDVEAELLASINTGLESDSNLSRYFRRMKSQLPAETLVDLLNYLRLYLELALSAKGVLLQREAGFEPAPLADADARFAELDDLERRIGPVGKRALAPFLHASRQDLWQLHVLDES